MEVTVDFNEELLEKLAEDLHYTRNFTNLDGMAEQRLAEIYEMGYDSVEDWYKGQYVVPDFAKLTVAEAERLTLATMKRVKGRTRK